MQPPPPTCWVYNLKGQPELDLRHQALMSFYIHYSALEPGGWIEQMELDVRVYSDDTDKIQPE
jgi:hypothetical protein